MDKIKVAMNSFKSLFGLALASTPIGAVLMDFISADLLLQGLGASFLLWVLFASLMTMKAKHEQGNLSRIAYLFGYYILLPIGALVDAFYNWTFAIILFGFDLPEEVMLTSRLQRYIHEDKWAWSWQRTLALWLCQYLIEPWDYDHCSMSKVKP